MRSLTPARPILALAALALVAAACTGGETTTTTTTEPRTTTSIGVAPPATGLRPGDPAYDEMIPLDPDVRTGILDNGLTYFVRENDAPGSRLQLRLVVDAGSLLEDDDQSGAAHFLEHMMFNGTERWPKNELVAVLESFGAQFGPDVNAYTSYDETVYQLVVATDDDTVDLAFDVLREWASRATISQGDVVDERGVVIEEWRLRDQGIGGRISTWFEELLISGTDYEGKAPIGLIATLERTNAEELARFYTDWYRPDLMAIIAVGDLPVDRLQAEIVDRFADLESPPNRRNRPQPNVPVIGTPRIVAAADPDLPTAFAEFLYPNPATPAGSYGALRDQMASQIAWDLIARRLDDDIVAGIAGFLAVGAVEIPFARALASPGIEIDAEAGDLGSAVQAIAEEIERVRRHGFTEAEFRRAVERRRGAIDQELASVGTRQDVEYAEALVNTFLNGVPLPSADAAYGLEIRALDDLTSDMVEEMFLDVVAGAPAILTVGPDVQAGALPTEEQIVEILEFVVAASIEPREDRGIAATGLMDRPATAAVIDRATDIFDTTWLTFANGVRVGLLETSIAENTVVLGGASPGGYSVFAIEDATEASSIADIVATSGVGDFDRADLEQLLIGQIVGVAPYMDAVSEGFFGEAAAEDLETLLQLVHLYMTAPRADASAVATYLSQIRPFVAAPLDIPGVAATVTLSWSRYGMENLWYTIPPLEELDTFDVDVALDAYRDRFGDAGDFVFALAGDFETDSVIPLVASYFGTLPGTGRSDTFVDRQPDPPQGAVVETLRVGSDPQGDVSFLITGELDAGADERIHARLLELVTSTRLRDRLREALAATYSPVILIDTLDAPDMIIETFIQVSGDPERLAEISSETIAVLADLAATGPTAAELATAREQLIREYELVSNEFWVDTLTFFAHRPDESIADIAERIPTAQATTIDDLRRLAAIAWPTGRYIEVRQIPE